MLSKILFRTFYTVCDVLGPWLGHQWACNIVLFCACFDVLYVMVSESVDLKADTIQDIENHELLPEWIVDFFGTTQILLLVSAGWFWCGGIRILALACRQRVRQAAEKEVAAKKETRTS
jgi:hypothetical protein